MKKNPLSFWQWFFMGSGGKKGFRSIINLWFLFHLVIGIVLSLIIKIPLNQASNTVLLPLAGIFIGLSFAWSGNAQALLQSLDIQAITRKHPGGFSHYVFTFQTAILVIIITLILWGFAGLSLFDDVSWFTKYPIIYFIIKVILYSFASMTLRECWHVIMGVQILLLSQNQIDESRKNHNSKEGDGEKH